MLLFVHEFDRLTPTTIVTGAAAPLNWVFVSADGQWVGFVEGRTLKKVAVTGGPVVTIFASNSDPRGATWAPEDTIIIGDADPMLGLQRVSAQGGGASVLTRPDPARGEFDHVWPEMLPGGRAVLFTITAITGGLASAQVAVFDLATRMPRVLVQGGSHAHYIPSGHLVYTAGGTLRAIPFDIVGLQTRGESVEVLPVVVTNPAGGSNFAVAADGTLAYVDVPDVTSEARTLVWVDRYGVEEPLGTPARPYLHPRLSPDGTQMAVAINDHEADIWLWDFARRSLRQLTFSSTGEMAPVWTSDGNRLVFFSPSAQGGSTLFWQSVDGTGPAEGIGCGCSFRHDAGRSGALLARSAGLDGADAR